MDDSQNLKRMWTKRNSKRGIERALQLHNRGEARKDGLQLVSASTSLEITWTARDVHPWDRHGSQEQTGAQFVRQALNDAEDAITRLFDNLPDIEEIAVSVLESGSDKIIMAGTVHRSSLAKQPAASVKMRLMNWGIRFSLTGSYFEPVSNR